jgi:hypothetical protein
MEPTAWHCYRHLSPPGRCSSKPMARCSSTPTNPSPESRPPSWWLSRRALITTGTGNKTKVSGITVFFNTAVNSTMASNGKIYQVRIGRKGKNLIKIKRATYNSSNNSVTLHFRGSSKLNKKGYQVLIAASTGIVEADAEILNKGAVYMVYAPPTPAT